MKTYEDNEGKFEEWKDCLSHSNCPKNCSHPKEGLIQYRIWESNDGAYEDYQYKCTNCGHTWWVDGIDS